MDLDKSRKFLISGKSVFGVVGSKKEEQKHVSSVNTDSGYKAIL